MPENRAVGSLRTDDDDPPRGKGTPDLDGLDGEPDQALRVGQREPGPGELG